MKLAVKVQQAISYGTAYLYIFRDFGLVPTLATRGQHVPRHNT
jgi:hypothetical protein